MAGTDVADEPNNRRPRRPGSRVLLVDERDRVLLLRVVHDHRIVVPGQEVVPETYWIVPGGGAEAGETPEETARREVLEETGIADFDLGPFLWERRLEVTLDGIDLLAVESFYAGAVERPTTTFDHLDALERGVIVEHRWWTVDEIDARGDVIVFPDELAELARRAVAARPS